MIEDRSLNIWTAVKVQPLAALRDIRIGRRDRRRKTHSSSAALAALLATLSPGLVETGLVWLGFSALQTTYLPAFPQFFSIPSGDRAGSNSTTSDRSLRKTLNWAPQ